MGPQSNYGYYGEQKKGINKKLIALIAGGLIIAIGLVITISILSKQNSIGTQSQHLSAQLNNLATLTTDAASQLQSSDLQKINAETGIITDGVQSDLGGILPKKPDKGIVTAESDKTDTDSLASAALAGTYDDEYKTVLTQKLQSITAVLTEMYDKTHSKVTRDALNTAYKNYQAIQTNLDKASL